MYFLLGLFLAPNYYTYNIRCLSEECKKTKPCAKPNC